MQTPAELLEEIRSLMELKGENPFKVRAFERASQALAGREDLAERARAGTLTELEGVGKGISDVLTEFLSSGTSRARDELRASLPPGLPELVRVPGLGPKKARLLIEQLGIASLAELEYACRENRLLKLPGFGVKLQLKIQEGIAFLHANQGRRRIDEALPLAERALARLRAAVPGAQVSETGALRRRLETLSSLEFLVEGEPRAELETLARAGEGGLPIELRFAPAARFGAELARTTGTPEHWAALGAPEVIAAANHGGASEDAFFAALGLPPIAPELRETGEEVKLAREGKLGALLGWDGVRGVFHNHTTRSDGSATLDQMIVAARNLGFKYIGISDHSQSAFYAQGLKPDALADQEREIREAQERHPDIRVFWGIESDILQDGSLDYDSAALKRFDFVIASVHSRFQMDREAMTDRIVAAIRHPATRFLGHMTGRLLLGRAGYELNVERIIREAAEHDVAIEINANPARLDIDWRWGAELRRHGTLVSVNPDAHEEAGLADTVFGVGVARKALLPASAVVNAREADEVAKWLKRA
jgi:DNA polymerase (family 10)